MKSKKLKVPAFFDFDFLNQLIYLNNHSKNNTVIAEVYGSFPDISHSQTRINERLSNSTLNFFKEYVSYAHQNGIEFDYIMNGTCYGNKSKEELIDDFLSEITVVRLIGIKKITASSPFLIQFIRSRFPDMQITASINLCTNSVGQALRWQDMGVNRIVLDRSINRNGKLVKIINSHLNIETELLVNSMCLCFCGMHQFHNNMNSHINDSSDKSYCYNYPYSKCFETYLKNPIEMICSGWIRPEDLDLYQTLGISNFKLEGRGEDKEIVLKIISIYMNNEFNGNIFDLLFTGYKTKQRVEAYLDNNELSDIFNKIVMSKVDCQICGGNNPYCMDIANKITFNEEKLNDMLNYIDSLNNYVVNNSPFPENIHPYIIT